MSKFHILLVLMFLPVLTIPVYGLESEFTNEEEKIEFKEITSTWINNTITNDEYVNVVKTLVEDRDLILYTRFNQNELSIPLLNYFNGLKTDAESWLNNADGKTDNAYANDLEQLANYGILGIDDPSRIFLSTDKLTYFANDEIFLDVDMLGYKIQEDELGLIVNNYYEDDSSGSAWVDVNSVPVTLDLKDNFSFNNIGNYTIEIQYGKLQNSTSFQIIPDYMDIQADKSSYYLDETISITGELDGVLAEIDDEVEINILDYQGRILIPQQTATFSDSTFFYHDIITDDIAWEGYDDTVTIISQYGNYTSYIQFHYSNYPAELSLTYLHDKVMIHNNTLDTHDTTLDDHASITSIQNDTINYHDTILDSHDVILDSHETLIYSLNDMYGTLIGRIDIVSDSADIIYQITELQSIDIDELDSSHTALEDTLAQQQNTTDSHGTMLESLNATDATHLNSIGNLNDMINNMDQQIENQNIETQYQIDFLNNSTSSQELEIDELDSLLTTLNSTVTSQELVIDRLDTSIIILNDNKTANDMKILQLGTTQTVIIDTVLQQQNITDSHETSIALNEADIDTQQELIESQNAEIVELNAQIQYMNTQFVIYDSILDTLTLQVAELLDHCDDCDTDTPPQTPRQTPIIKSFMISVDSIVDSIADDVTRETSENKIITIQFNHNTNTPYGTGIISKEKIDQLFTFSDDIGSNYTGKWVTPDKFIISISNTTGSQIIPNITTVTPSQIVPILSYDANPENISTEESPPLNITLDQ